MAIIPRSFSPRVALRDLKGFLGERHDHGLVFLLLSIALAGGVLSAVIWQFSGDKPYKEAEVTYVKQWPSSRTVEEVRAQQLKDQPAERAERARREAEEAKRREQFRRAGEALKSVGVGN